MNPNINSSRHALALAVGAALMFPAMHASAANNPLSVKGEQKEVSGGTYETTNQGWSAVKASLEGIITAEGVTAITTGSFSDAVLATGVGSSITFNGGSISTSGREASAVRASSGGTVNVGRDSSASGSVITVDGDDAAGVRAGRSQVNVVAATIVNNGNSGGANVGAGVQVDTNGVVNLEDTNIVMNGRGLSGIGAGRAGATVDMVGGSITTGGDSARGANVFWGATANFDGVTIVTSGQGSTGLKVANGGDGGVDNGLATTASFKSGVISTSGNKSVGIDATSGGAVELVDTVVETFGANAHGISATDAGTVNARNVDVTVHGDGAVALMASGAGGIINHDGGTLTSEGGLGNAAADIRLATVTSKAGAAVSLNNVSVQNLYTNLVSGPDGQIPDVRLGMGVMAEGSTVNIVGSTVQAQDALSSFDGATLEVSDSFIESLGGWGILASEDSTANVQGGTIMVRQSEVSTTVPNSTGRAVNAADGGQISLLDTAVEVQQFGGVGLESYGAGSLVDMTGGSVVMTADNAYGAMAGYGDWVPGLLEGTINLTGTQVELRGKESIGLLAHYAGDINAVDTTVLATGADSYAAYVDNGKLDLDASSLVATGESGVGLMASAGSQVDAHGSEILSNTGTAIMVDGDATIDLVGSKAWSGAGSLLANDVSEDGTGLGTTRFNAARSELTGDIVFSDGYTGVVDLSDGSSLHGAAQNVDDLRLADSRWDMTGDSLVGMLSASNSTIAFDHDDGAFKTLTVTGDYVADNAVLQMNTVLGDDASLTDKLHVLGNTAGQSGILVNNVGGQGAETFDGIQLVQVDGDSAGVFNLLGRAVGGSYEYFLHQGGVTDPSDGDWYLRSELPVEPPVDPDPCTINAGGPGCPVIDPPVEPEVPVDPPVDPVDPVDPPTDPIVIDPPVDPEIVDPPVVPPPTKIYRPETGAYLANQAAAVGMFDMTLHERLGEPNLAQRLKSDDTLASAWVRTTSDHTRFNAGEGQLDVASRQSMLQVGTDFAKWGDDSRGLAGIMLATGRSSSQTTSNVTGYGAKGEVDGKALGLYATWMQSADSEKGAYLDAWLQAARFKNEVQGDALATERYDSKALMASIEAGYAMQLHEGADKAFYLEPQAQLTYTDYSMDGDKHVETNGTTVQTADAGGVQTRLGVRLYGHDTSSEGNRVQPFVAANWIHSEGDNAMAFNGVGLAGGQPSEVYELKAGAQLQMGGGWTGWGELSTLRGKNDYRNYGAQMGVKYSW